jgi:hypothetical protein
MVKSMRFPAKLALVCLLLPLSHGFVSSFLMTKIDKLVFPASKYVYFSKSSQSAGYLRYQHSTTFPLMSGSHEEKFLGSRRLHKALKSDSDHKVRKDRSPHSFSPCGDWGKILPLAERPKPPPLDKLSDLELRRVLAGERLQKQSRAGRVGHGLVVCDVKADASLVYAILSDIQRYPLRVPTVREAAVQYDSPHAKICKAQFKLSRFRLEINAELRCLRDRNAIEFRLDPERENPVLEQARGFWFVEDASMYGRGKGWTRVWLVADITCSPLLPSFLVDHAASRALPRATSWIAPVLDALADPAAPQKQAGVNTEPAQPMHSLVVAP